MNKALRYIFLCSVVGIVASCNDGPKETGLEYMPDMYRSPSYETYSSNPVFKDSMTAQQPVAGTIARGNAIYSDLDRMPYAYPNTNEGYEAAGVSLRNPLERTETNMTEGKRLYDNFCTHCHGEKGMGDGIVVTEPHTGPKPPAYNGEQLKTLPEGKMYHTVEYGKNMMGSHASQLTASQRWKIIMYVQTLQSAGGNSTAAADSAQKTMTAKKS
jgi:mono/diheme cytochrome c family protein